MRKKKFDLTSDLIEVSHTTQVAKEDNENKARALATVLQMEGDNWNISNPSLVSRP